MKKGSYIVFSYQFVFSLRTFYGAQIFVCKCVQKNRRNFIFLVLVYHFAESLREL